MASSSTRSIRADKRDWATVGPFRPSALDASSNVPIVSIWEAYRREIDGTLTWVNGPALALSLSKNRSLGTDMTMEAELAALTAEVRRLADIEAVKKLTAGY